MLEWQQINSTHVLDKKFSGLEALDKWLIKKAVKVNSQNDSRVSVLCDVDTLEVISFYSLKLGQEPIENAPSDQRQKLTHEGIAGSFPCVKMQWLGVKKKYQGQGFGEATLQEALINCANIFDVTGGYGIVLTPENGVEAFYKKYGFDEVGSGFSKRMLMPAKVIFDYRDLVRDKLKETSNVDATT